MALKTSIILCTYNEANYIEETVKAIKKNIQNLEIIIVDDKSVVNSFLRVELYEYDPAQSLNSGAPPVWLESSLIFFRG